jgi:hypothetical protein
MAGELEAHGLASDQVKWLAVHYPASGVETLLDGGFIGSVYAGVYRVYSMILEEESNCPREKLVVAGYSQGALVVHIALRHLAAQNPVALGGIAAVLMLADPAKVSQGSETTWEDDHKVAGSGVNNADGLWTKLAADAGYGSDVGALPSAVTGRTLALCYNHDLFCAPGLYAGSLFHWDFAASAEIHGSYATPALEDMGIWAADAYLATSQGVT